MFYKLKNVKESVFHKNNKKRKRRFYIYGINYMSVLCAGSINQSIKYPFI